MPGARGEATIEAGDREVAVLYTNRALAEAEEQIGKSIIETSQGFAEGKIKVSDVAHLLRAGMEAARRDARTGGRPVSMPAVFEVLDEVGLVAVAEVVMIAVAEVLTYGTDAEVDDLPNP